MRLQGHAARSDPATAERVNGYVDTLDEVIKKIRTSIFGLQQPRQAPASLPARLMEIIDEHAPQLGFTAGVSFAGLLDPARTRHWPTTSWPSPARPCPTAPATPTPPPSASPWCCETG